MNRVVEHTTFAFGGTHAGHLSVMKESRSRGAGACYASSRQTGHTRKHYLGRNLRLTLHVLTLTHWYLPSGSNRVFSKQVQGTSHNKLAGSWTVTKTYFTPSSSKSGKKVTEAGFRSSQKEAASYIWVRKGLYCHFRNSPQFIAATIIMKNR